MLTYVLYIDREKSKAYSHECLDSYLQTGMKPEKLVMFQGFCGLDNTQLTELTGYRILTDLYASEYCSTVGHIAIWKAIVESNEIGVVLEHDAIIKADYSNLHPNDGELLFLGPRLYDRNDYNFPVQYANNLETINISYHHGAHAYMITPATAKMMLDQIENVNQIPMPIDGLLGLKNIFNMKLTLVDPPVAIAEIGARESFNFEQPDATNRFYTEKFLAAVKPNANLPAILDFQFNEDTFTQNIPLILKSLEHAGIYSNNKINILEVGASSDARSTCWFVENMLVHRDSKIDIIAFIEDQNNENHYMYNLSLCANCNKTKSYKGQSRDFFPHFLADGEKYDLIYFNDSAYDNIILDSIACFHLLKNDGIIVFNNYLLMHNDKHVIKFLLGKIENLLSFTPIVDDYAIAYMKS
jgi:hypothetical protein